MSQRYLIISYTALLMALSSTVGAVQQGVASVEVQSSAVVANHGSLGDELGSQQQILYRQALQRLKERLVRYPDDYEARLLGALIRFKSGNLDAALDELAELTRREPKFHLAYLIQGDLLLARARVVSDFGAAPVLGRSKEKVDDIAHLRQEAEARLNAYLETLPQGRLPRALLVLDDAIKTALVVDKNSHRLYVYERSELGTPELLQDFYVSTGKLNGNKSVSGDLKTPEGVYFITSHIPDEKLPDLYGIGAYPMNYPNEWDQKLGKTGYGIWLHGTETAFYSRPPLDSEGCVVLPNLDLQNVSRYLKPGLTPIIVTDSVEWMERAEWQQLRTEVADAVEKWRSDWASTDVERYLTHYDRAFWGSGYTLGSWKARKRRVAMGKKWQKVTLSDLSLFAYPRQAGDGKEMVVADFHQSYDSNNYNSEMNKRLYLVKRDGHWRVLYEGGR